MAKGEKMDGVKGKGERLAEEREGGKRGREKGERRKEIKGRG